MIVFFLTRPFLASRSAAFNASAGGNPLTLDTSFLPGLSLSGALNATGGGETSVRGMGLDGEPGDLGKAAVAPSTSDLYNMSVARMEKLRKIEELIAQRPEDAATILHVWMER